MNKLLKSILTIVGAVAVEAVPGARAVKEGIHRIIVERTQTGGRDVSEGVIRFLEAVKGEEIADEQLFRQGIEQLEAGFDTIQASLKRRVS